MEQALTVEFLDANREPKCAPNPEFPNGKDVDASFGSPDTCSAEIPYPAPRCGVMLVKCKKCGLTIGLTVAGRIDDPRSVKVACRQTIN